MTINIVTESRGLDPLTASLSSVTDYSRMNAIYDVLVWADAKTGEIRPQLAESLRTTDGGKTWTLALRDGVKFSDGTPLDAAAVKFTWDAIGAPNSRSLYVGSVRGVATEVVDPRTLRITLDQANARFDQIVAANLAYVMSPTAYAKNPQGFSRNPVGAGPYLLKEWVKDYSQTYTRNPGYWQPGKPYLDEVVFRTVTDQRQSFNSVSSGGADAVITLDIRSGALARDAGFAIEEIALNGPGGVLFNMKRPPFDDPRARRALSLAIDKEALTKIVFEGAVPPPRGLFAAASTQIDQAAVPTPLPDTKAAAALAKELTDAGKPLDFTLVMPQSTNSAKVAEYLQQQWDLIPGVHVKIEILDINTLIAKTLVARDYQAFYYNLATPGEPVLWNSLHSTSSGNFMGYSSPAADEALAASRTATTPEALKAAYTRLAQAFAADVPLIPLQESISYVYAKPGRFAGLELTNAGAILMDRLGHTG